MDRDEFWKVHVLIVQLCVLGNIALVDGMLTVFPVDTSVEVGSDVRFNCTTSTSNAVNWQYGKDPDGMADVYISGEGLVRPYSKSSRHFMDEDSRAGRYDLIIKGVSKEDEGIYVCSEKASRDNYPQARLTVTGNDPQWQSCLIYEIFAVGAEAKLNFSTCSCKPFYIDHVPVGKSHADDLYNNGHLLNDYAKSGRFRIDDASGGSCALYITNVQTPDAGTYRCRENSGLGQMHDKDLIVLEETCDNVSAVFTRSEMNGSLESNCAISLVGHRKTLDTWLEFNCNGSLCSVENATSISPLVCILQNPTRESEVLLQCEFFHYTNDEEGTSTSILTPSENQNLPVWLVSLVTVVTICVTVGCLAVFLIVWRLRSTREPNVNNTSTSINDDALSTSLTLHRPTRTCNNYSSKDDEIQQNDEMAELKT